MDMHSGGGCKEKPYEHIYIEAPQAEAEVIFYNRFKHNPNRITCTCCGEDYSINEHETLEQATAFERNCAYSKDGYVEKQNESTRRFVDGAKNDVFVWNHYLDENPGSKYMTLEVYLKQPNILVIKTEDIKPEERVGEVPVEGYVWI
jgi:hypothetical protein